MRLWQGEGPQAPAIYLAHIFAFSSSNIIMQLRLQGPCCAVDSVIIMLKTLPKGGQLVD